MSNKARLLCSAMAYRWTGGIASVTTWDVARSLDIEEPDIELARAACAEVQYHISMSISRATDNPEQPWPDARDAWAEAERQLALGWRPGQELR